MAKAKVRALPARLAKAIIAANVPTSLPQGRKFLILGPHVWGKGDTISEAYTNAREEGAGVEKQCILFDAPANTTVDGMGYTEWTWEKDQERPEPARELLKYGVK